MTDRISGFIVTLDQDIREDDVESIISAIRHIRHVAHVEPKIATYEDVLARERARYAIGDKLLDLHREINGWSKIER
jgi:hypothetical protein